jgi:thymidine kinase
MDNLKKITAFIVVLFSLQSLHGTENIHATQKAKGRLKVVCGSMYSGKTEELMRRLKRAEYANKRILTIKHSIDDRYSHIDIVSHAGKKRSALIINDQPNTIGELLELARDFDIIGIDEIQFFSPAILAVIDQLIQDGKCIIVAGLDLDFRGEPFGIMPTLMAKADQVLKLKAICACCGKNAHHSQRLIDGKPAKYDDPLIGVNDCYEARCRNCFTISK